MKHINMSNPIEKVPYNGLAKHMITQESNNFGDQILSMKVFVSDDKSTRYETVAMQTNQEGSWLETSEMRAWYTDLKKRGAL